MRKVARIVAALVSLSPALVCLASAEDIMSFNTIERASPATIKEIEILNPKLTFRRFVIQRYGGLEWPIISFTITNGSPITIQKIYLEAVLKIDGRPVPLAAQELVYSIRGGLQPHERKHFDLDANIVGDWGNLTKTDVGKANLMLTLKAVDDAEGAKIVR